MKKKKVVILGAGITGLVTAYYFSQNKNFEVTLIEKEKYVGGTAFSFEYKGFILDYGPHKIYTELPGIIDEISKITPLIKIKKKNSIYLKDNLFDFPLKISQIATKMPITAINSGIDIFTKSLTSLPDNSYENYLINRFGKTLYRLSFKDYAQKVWSSNPRELDKELAIKRVAVSNIFELIKGILLKDTEKISAEYFYYPPKGIKQILDNLVIKIKENGGQILTGKEILEIKIEDYKLRYFKLGNKIIKPDYLISTIHLNSLLNVINDSKKSENLVNSASKLEYQKVSILYFILNKERAMRNCWIFFPEKKLFFHRISEQKAFSEQTSPKDKTCLMVETTKKVNKENIEKIISQLQKLRILKQEEIAEYLIKTKDDVYPIYKKGFLQNLQPIISYLESIENFYTIGRPGLFNYNNMDQCWDMAKKTYEQIDDKKSKKEWQKTKEYFGKYRIVD
jgi:protoporphyrinogen oxidase